MGKRLSDETKTKISKAHQKLTPEQKVEIRSLLQNGMKILDVAALFRVSRMTIIRAKVVE